MSFSSGSIGNPRSHKGFFSDKFFVFGPATLFREGVCCGCELCGKGQCCFLEVAWRTRSTAFRVASAPNFRIRLLQQAFFLEDVSGNGICGAVHANDHEADSLCEIAAGVEVGDGGGFVVVWVGGELVNLEAIAVVFFYEGEVRETFEERVISNAAQFQNGVVHFEDLGLTVVFEGDEASGGTGFEFSGVGFVVGVEARGFAFDDLCDAGVIR